MIVLVVMAGVLAVAWPNLQKSLYRASLNEAAQTLQGVLGEAQVQAIQTGEIWVVQMNAGEPKIVSGPLGLFAEELESRDEGESSATIAWVRSNDFAAPATASSVSMAQLPRGVELSGVSLNFDGNRSNDSSEANDEMERDEIPPDAYPSATAESARWWIPMLPNGTGRSAEILLRDLTTGESIRVVYDGTTGTIEIRR